MSWSSWFLVAVGVYLLIGCYAVVFLKQTPYADNPIWTMILLWPLFLIG